MAVPSTKPIPISAARIIAKNFGYDQVVIVARKVGAGPSDIGEHVTTYGIDKANCDVAARIGDFLKYKVMGWHRGDGRYAVVKVPHGYKDAAEFAADCGFELAH